MHQWGPRDTGFTLKHFGPSEFKYPTLMDEGFLKDLDDLREGCGFPLTITDSARTQQDLERIYAREIARGESYPTDSAHLFTEGNPVRAVDLKPAIPKAWRWQWIGLGSKRAGADLSDHANVERGLG